MPIVDLFSFKDAFHYGKPLDVCSNTHRQTFTDFHGSPHDRTRQEYRRFMENGRAIGVSPISHGLEKHNSQKSSAYFGFDDPMNMARFVYAAIGDECQDGHVTTPGRSPEWINAARDLIKQMGVADIVTLRGNETIFHFDRFVPRMAFFIALDRELIQPDKSDSLLLQGVARALTGPR